MILVDTSVIVASLRGHETSAVLHLRRMEQEGAPVAVPVPCAMEVLAGSRDERAWKACHALIDGLDLVEPAAGWESHLQAARIFFECRRRGLTVSSSVDCLIAQIAIEQDAVLLHDDRDFELIARVRPLQQLR